MMERVGEGEAIHREQRWRKCLHSTFRYTMQGKKIEPVCFFYILTVQWRSNQLNVFKRFYFHWKAFMAHV